MLTLQRLAARRVLGPRLAPISHVATHTQAAVARPVIVGAACLHRFPGVNGGPDRDRAAPPSTRQRSPCAHTTHASQSASATGPCSAPAPPVRHLSSTSSVGEAAGRAQQAGGEGGEGGGGPVGMFATYQELVGSGRLKRDPSQELGAALLEGVQRRMGERRERRAREAEEEARGELRRGQGEGGAAAVAESSAALPHPPIIIGSYLWGPVGSGKSMLMDVFFSTVDAPGGKKRLHFHEFMLGVHSRLHALQEAVPKTVVKTKGGLRVFRHTAPLALPPGGEGEEGAPRPKDVHPLTAVAREIAGECEVLCLDEMMVTDVGDAMVLRRLFQAIFGEGVAVVFTSNRPPADLYKGGLSWDYFAPFIELVGHLDVLTVGAGTDYRALPPGEVPRGEEVERWGHVVAAPGRGAYHTGPAARAALEAAWGAMSGGVPLPGRAEAVATGFGRAVAVPRGARPAVAWFTFRELCARGAAGTALGPADFVALAGAYKALVVEGVPRLARTQRDEARRWVTLIDTAYENRIHLTVSAECPVDQVFGELDAELQELRGAALQGAGDPSAGREETGAGGSTVSLSQAEEESFMFRRAVSRLVEMGARVT